MTNESLFISCEFMKINIIYVLTGSVSKRSIIHKHWDKKNTIERTQDIDLRTWSVRWQIEEKRKNKPA